MNLFPSNDYNLKVKLRGKILYLIKKNEKLLIKMKIKKLIY